MADKIKGIVQENETLTQNDFARMSVNDFVENLRNFNPQETNNNPFCDIKSRMYVEKNKDKIKIKINSQSFTMHDVICAIAAIVIFSNFFDGDDITFLSEKEKKELARLKADFKEYVDKKKKDNEKYSKPSFNDKNAIIFKIWIKKIFNENDLVGEHTTQSGTWDNKIGTQYFSIFRDKVSPNKSNGNKPISNVCSTIIKYLRGYTYTGPSEDKEADVHNYANTFEEIWNQLFDVKIKEGEQIMESKNNYKEEIIETLNNGTKQIILTGAPGTGKTKMAKDIADGKFEDENMEEGFKDEIEKCKGSPLLWKKDNEKRYELVQFHPSYDYTDFIEGLRPVESEGNIVFKKIDGIFKSFCRHVAELNKDDNDWENKKYFFIIDEINRADLSKVFGELMYCLESDKRGSENAVQTQYQNLNQFYTENELKSYYRQKKILETKWEEQKREDEFADGFYIPENVYIIGTMNDIDRSVESMDFALRRRFMWREIEVSEDLLKDAFNIMLKEAFEKEEMGEYKPYNNDEEQRQTLADKLAGRVNALNETIEKDGEEFDLNKHYFISQGQFANLPTKILEKLPKPKTDNEMDVKEFLEEVFEWRIKYLLREYVRGEKEEDVKKFIDLCKAALDIN